MKIFNPTDQLRRQAEILKNEGSTAVQADKIIKKNHNLTQGIHNFLMTPKDTKTYQNVVTLMKKLNIF